MNLAARGLGMAMALPPQIGMAAQESMENEAMETPEYENMEAAAVQITPEAVCYRDGQQVCSTCQYMEESGECQPLKIVVDPGGGCNLHKERLG